MFFRLYYLQFKLLSFCLFEKKCISEFSYCTEFRKVEILKVFTKIWLTFFTIFELLDLKLSVNSLLNFFERGRQCCFGRNCFYDMALNRSIRSVHMGSRNHGIHKYDHIHICMDILHNRNLRNLHTHTKHRD